VPENVHPSQRDQSNLESECTSHLVACQTCSSPPILLAPATENCEYAVFDSTSLVQIHSPRHPSRSRPPTATYQAPMYVLRIIPGWIAISVLFYIYVVKQLSLVVDFWVLAGVMFLGILLSFLCSSIEMALASIGERELTRIAAQSRQLLVEIDIIGPAEYAKRQLKLARVMDICYSANNLNAPIVIFNNVANILIASFIPLALSKGNVPNLTATFAVIGSIAIPGAGTEALTFIATIVFLVIFGEVIPKKLAREYPLWFIQKLAIIIRSVDLLFGWLGNSFLSIVVIPTYLLRRIFGST